MPNTSPNDSSNRPQATSEKQNGNSYGLARPAVVDASLILPIGAVVLTMFFWATTPIVIRNIYQEVPPIGLSFARTFVAFLVLLPFTLGATIRQWRLVCANWKIFALLGLFLWVGGNTLLAVSLQFTFAINVAVINSVEPALIIFFAWIFYRDPFSWRQGIGLIISLIGVITLIARGSLERLSQLQFNLGDIIIFGAFAAWAMYPVFIRKVPREMDPRATALAIMGFGAAFLLPLYILETIFWKPMPYTLDTLYAVVGLAIFASAAGVLLWNYGLSKLGPAWTGQFLHLIPAFTVVLAIVILGEKMAFYHAAGLALIALGLVVTLYRRSAK